MKSYIRRILMFSMLCALVLTGTLGNLSAEEKAERIARSVDTAVLKEGSFDLPFATTGYLEAIHEVSVSPKIAGLISEMKVDIGSRVKKGDVLFTFDDSYIKLDLQTAEAAVSVAEANLNDMLAGARQEDVASAKLALENAKLAYQLAEIDFKRTEQLFKSGNETEQKYVEEGLKLKILATTVAQTEETYKKVTNGATQTQIAVLKQVLAQTQSTLAKAKQQMEDATVRAPFDGIITERTISVGGWIAPKDKGITLLDDSSLRFAIGFPERYAMLLKPGIEVTIRFNGNIETRKIDFIVPAVNTVNRTITAYINFDNSKGIYPVNLIGEISTSLTVTGVVVPSTALVYRGSSVFLCTIVDGKAKFAEVMPSVSSGGFVKISGIPTGVTYVTKSASDIFENESLSSTPDKK